MDLKSGSFSVEEITRENINRFHYINKISIHMKYKTKEGVFMTNVTKVISLNKGLIKLDEQNDKTVKKNRTRTFYK